MDYNNKLINELISILDKRTAIAKSELNKALEYVKIYDVSITDYIKSDQQIQTNDYTGKINELTENTKDSFKLIRNEIDRKLGENKQENINAINSAKNDLIIKLDNFKSDANTYTDTNINTVKDKIDDVDTKYNNIITTLSDAYNTSFDDIYDKIRTGIDTLYFKYDASMKEFDTKIDSSFRTILQYINTSVAILRNQTLTNAKILEDNLNASINRIKGLLDIDIDDLYTYIDDQLDDIDKEQLIQNTSINKIKSDVDILIKSSGEMSGSIVGLRKEFNEFRSDTTENFKLVNNNINLITKDVTKIDTTLDEHIKKYNEHVSKSDNYIITNDKNIQDIQAKISNIDLSYNNLNTDITNLTTNFNTLVNSDNANNVIDTFKEVETFLSSISDASTLTGILEQMSKEMNKKIDNIIINGTINVSIDDINSSITDISSRLYNYINSNNGISTNIDTSIDNINSSINGLNSSINDISTRLNNNYVSKDDYIKDEEAITTAFVQLDNKINDISIDVLSTEYINELNQETTSGFKTLGTCLDFILSSMYYTKPVSLNVTFTATPTSIIKGKETNVVFTYVINNYKNNISNIVYNNKVSSDLTYTERINITDNISRTLKVETNYKDNKGASPTPFNRTITVGAIQELYYWSSADGIYENNYTVENKPNWNTYTYKSNTYSINFNNQGEDKYIFFVTSSDIPETKFFIYQHGSSPTLSGGIKKIGIITIQLYNIPLKYYLYRTNNVLGGDYDIKW